MKVRRGRGVRIRRDEGFGGIVYVPHRDDFFAATREVYSSVEALGNDFALVSAEAEITYTRLAELGICETRDPTVVELAYTGPSFLGEFPEIPTVELPLVVNCFSTSHCPLRCIYCHADDLMEDFRGTEGAQHSEKWERDLRNVLSTASMVPAIVAVITGGEPLARPERTVRLIEGLAAQKALVMDTSGVGRIDVLMPHLVKHQIHVRVSLDSLAVENDEWRPLNTDTLASSEKASSRSAALTTIGKCLDAGLGVTVQTVVHSQNDKRTQLRTLRDGLIAMGVRNWVLHIAVKGGRARKKEREVAKDRKRRGSILPRLGVREDLWRLVEETIRDGLNIDIRCTDTDSTPNSVLLISTEGDLYTEGYAHNGKFRLYDSRQNRPDQVRALWSHIDKFGHARRYLNWNPWYFRGHESLSNVCYAVPTLPVGEQSVSATHGLVETEAKYYVRDILALEALLSKEGFVLDSCTEQRDEYYDTPTRSLSTLDYALRLRREGETPMLAFKGPRLYAAEGEYSRLELEFTAASMSELRNEMNRLGLEKTWFFEKRRTLYRREDTILDVTVDEIPEVGFFLEIEGPSPEIRELEGAFAVALGRPETRNYRDIFVDYKRVQGVDDSKILGAAFE